MLQEGLHSRPARVTVVCSLWSSAADGIATRATSRQAMDCEIRSLELRLAGNPQHRSLRERLGNGLIGDRVDIDRGTDPYPHLSFSETVWLQLGSRGF